MNILTEAKILLKDNTFKKFMKNINVEKFISRQDLRLFIAHQEPYMRENILF